MIISVFSDGGKKDKIAELYDTKYPCAFLRGLLEENREDESEAEFTFTVRQEPDYNKMLMERPEVFDAHKTPVSKRLDNGIFT